MTDGTLFFWFSKLGTELRALHTLHTHTHSTTE